MHSNTLIPNSIPTTSKDNDYDIISNGNSLNSLSTTTTNSQDNNDVKLHNLDEFSHGDKADKIVQTSLSEPSSQLHRHEGEIVLDTDPNSGGLCDNNPPDSFWVSNNKVTDWLNHHTFIERKASVKLVAVSNKFDPTQTRSSQRSVSFNHVQQPKTTIIGFRQKPGHGSDTKSKQNERQDNIRLFKNRSVQVKSSVLHINEPKSPRVSCIGRVGSMRGRARRSTGFWKNVKMAILNRVRANKVKKDR